MSRIYTLTRAGKQAMLNAQAQGLQLSLTHIAIGDGQREPEELHAALLSERMRSPVAESHLSEGGLQLDLSAEFGASAQFTVYEVGVFAGAVLVFYWSTPEPAGYLAVKNAATTQLYGVSLAVAGLPDGVVTVVDSGQPLGVIFQPYRRALAAMAAETSRLALRDAQRLIRGHP